MRRQRGERRAAILLEVMLAVALFVMSGIAILSLVSGTMEGMGRMKLSRQAADLARSAMAKMEAGIETPQTLNGPVKEKDDAGHQAAEEPPSDGGWELQVDTEPTQFRGLTRITVTAVERAGGENVAASYTLRQLVRLSGKGAERVGDLDSLAEEAERGVRDQRPASERPAHPGGPNP